MTVFCMNVMYFILHQTLIAQRCVLHIVFNHNCFVLVRGYLAEIFFPTGCITEKRLRTTGLHGFLIVFHATCVCNNGPVGEERLSIVK